MRDIGHLITKRVLMKYSLVCCDDSELWLQSRDPFNDHNLSSQMRKIIEKEFPKEKDLILLVSRLEVDIASLLNIANLLHPHTFATDPLFISRNKTNDATWMKTRYRRDSLLQKELFFIFNSTVLINMLLKTAPEEKKALYDVPDFMDSVVTIPLKENSEFNLKAIDKRFKKVDKRKVVTSLQTHRTIGTLLTTQTALEEENYLR